MADIDSLIASGGNPTTKLDPIGSITKGLELKDLYMKSQTEQQQFSDNQAIRQAVSDNTKIDQNGMPTVDRQGLLKQLGQTAPNQVMPMTQQMAQNDYNRQQMQMNSQKEKYAYQAQLLNGVNDQDSYDQAKKLYAQAGFDSNGLPDRYDPRQVQLMLGRSLNYKDQIEQSQKEQELGIKAQQAKIEAGKLDLELKKNNAQQTQETMTLLQSARGNPAIQQAEKDVYANAKVNELVNQSKDKNGNVNPNLMNNTKVQLLASEVGKIASGGVATQDELQGLTPKNMPQSIAAMAEKYKNNPTPANAGAFVTQLQQYSNGVAQIGQKMMDDNYGRVLEGKRQFLDSQSYKTLNDQYLGKRNGLIAPDSGFSTAPASNSKKNPIIGGDNPHPQDSQAVQWAKSHPNDPRSAKILNLNGINMTAGR